MYINVQYITEMMYRSVVCACGGIAQNFDGENFDVFDSFRLDIKPIKCFIGFKVTDA